MSFDEHTSNANYKWTLSTEIVPICKVGCALARSLHGSAPF